MPDYNFLNLSPPEFENLVRDLLQEKFSDYLESFIDGQDGGIDFRFDSEEMGDVIIQCKRYTEFKHLLTNLKQEVKKVKKLNPKRYILATSVGLNPNRKKEINDLFNPYIISFEDILGKDDLNNLLGIYEKVESRHFKLWLSSTNILKKVLHSKIHNQSQFEIEKIQESIKLYVQNESFNESLKILKQYNYVIISGIPGIGKTTLARILTYHLLSSGFEEFIFLNSSIFDGYTLFQEGKKQVFLFDDFLGKNFLETTKSSNEEQSILSFIEKIQRSKNKALIFTTREYILNQAKSRYESFENPLLDKSKCVIDLSKYTTLVKAKILYNHLFFSKLPNKHINKLIKDSFYRRLIEHDNYSPRIIETITQNKMWEGLSPSEFKEFFFSSFENPENIWKHAYQKHITNLSKYILALMLTTGTPILYKDLFYLTQKFAEKLSSKYDFSFNEINFQNSLKELENTFISTQKNNRNTIVISYQNPSIQDFLVYYLKNKTDIIKDIIENIQFINQFSRAFGFEEIIIINGTKQIRKNKIFLKNELIDIYFEKAITDFDMFKSSRLISTSWEGVSESSFWAKDSIGISKKLLLIINDIILDEFPYVKDFVKSKFLNLIENKSLEREDLDSLFNLLRVFKDSVKIEKIILFEKIRSRLIWYQDLLSFTQMEDIYPIEFSEYKNSASFNNTVSQIAEYEYDSANDSNLEEILSCLEDMEEIYGLSLNYEIGNIRERMEEIEMEDESNWHLHEEYYQDEKFRRIEEKNEIEDLFYSLKNREE